jgi:DNA-binding transcriptional LysR family regulator
VTLAKSGAGLFQAYRFSVEKELREGALVEVLSDYAGRSRPFTLLYPSNRHVPLRLRAFIDYLMECREGWG